jgi:hypothetical protein
MPNYPALNGEDYARDGSKSIRKTLRQKVRQALGTSSDPAPDIRSALRAASDLKQIVDAASGGAYGLAVYNFQTGTHEPIDDVLYRISKKIHDNRVERGLPV